MSDNQDLAPEEVHEQNQRLIQALRHVYSISAEDSQSLARIQQRFQTANRLSSQKSYSAQQSAMIPGTQREIPGRASAKRYKTLWQHRLGTLAAALLVTLIVGTLGITLAILHQNKTETSKQTPIPTIAPARSHIALQSLHMIDALSGWAVTSTAILRTTDGGVHWNTVTPPHTTWWRAEAFLTDSIAWVLVENQQDGYVHALRTIDGGQDWHDTRLNYKLPRDSSEILNISAVNAEDCWLFAVSTILHTTDGGRTWRTLLTPEDTRASLFYVQWLTFRDAFNGWALGAGRSNTSIQLYITHDGGRTWQPQALSLPPHTTLDRALIVPPHFFNAHDGILPIGFATSNAASGWNTGFFVTHDGGVTWSMTALAMGIPPYGIEFLDLNHWITTSEEVTRSSYATIISITSDGGQYWTTIHPRSNYHSIYGIKFVSSNIGWALGNNVNPAQSFPGPPSGFMLKTEDGGRSWT
jgi:photosystem II stability/assembly factor-like uncharacterized protein